jgi:alkanesulfonate monooxygenase SsuD/methylene tetrahydromethanopterin reductase-like flavin-dependent oxidoreductase (luciferase family)
MRPEPDVADLVTFAVEAERAGLDAVMVSEHIVRGPSSGEAGLPANPRDYALPGNQDPATPWPSPLVLLSAIAAATSRIRVVAGALISPLRHPLASAKDLATLDRLTRWPSWAAGARCWRRWAPLTEGRERRGGESGIQEGA